MCHIADGTYSGDYYGKVLSYSDIQEHLSYVENTEPESTVTAMSTVWHPERWGQKCSETPLEPSLVGPIPAFKGDGTWKTPMRISEFKRKRKPGPKYDRHGRPPAHPDYETYDTWHGRYPGYPPYEFSWCPKDWHANTHMLYEVSVHNNGAKQGAIIDRGANGIVAGSDVRVFSHSVLPRHVDIGGIDNHRIHDREILSVCGVMTSQNGPVIAIFHQVAFHGKGCTILSALQMESFRVDISDKSSLRGGTQRLTTCDGYVFPIYIVQGLPYTSLCPPF